MSAPAFAQENRVSEVRVTAPSLEATLPEDLAQSGVKVDVIGEQAIRAGGYVDVAQAIQTLAPGLYIQPKNGPFDYVDISLQGSRTDDVLWLVDGVRINNRLYSGTPPLDTLPSSMVERIELLQGGQALFYGTAAVAGAVNIVTRGFSATPEGGLNLAADTNGGRHLDGYFSDSLGPNELVVYGSSDKSDGFKAFRDQDYQKSSTHRKRGYSVLTLGGKYGVELGGDTRVTASYQHTDADLDYALPYRVARDVNSRKEDLATVKLDYTPQGRFQFFLKGYYHYWHTRYDTFYNDLANPGSLIELYNQAYWGFKDYGANALGKLDLTKGVEAYFGYDFQSYGGRDEVLVIDQHNEKTHAVFGQLRLTPDLVQNLNLAAGFRYNDPSVGRSSSVWNVSGRYDFSDALFVRGEAASNFRLPTAEELFANDPLDEKGNPNLEPEKSRSLNLSVGGKVGPDGLLRWELIGFSREIKNLIDYSDDTNAAGQYVFVNVPGKVKTKGAEVNLTARVTEAVSASADYTHNSTKRDNGTQLARVPKDLAKLSIDFHPMDLPFGGTLSVNHVGQTFSPSLGSGLGAPQYGSYTVVDLSARWYLDAKRRHMLNLSVQNLMDEDYGRPARGCKDDPGDGPYDCSIPYIYSNRGLPRTARLSYSYAF